MRGGDSPALDRADRLYARLLWLLPGGFRREYGAAMRQTFADLCAARVDARGRGLAPVLASGLADLVAGAVEEWAVTVFARDRWHRGAAAGLCGLAGLLVLYSQVRYPADLLRIDDLSQDLLLLAVLAALAHGFANGVTVSARTVGCALATLPGWLAAPRAPLAGYGYVAALLLTAAIGAADRGGSRYAGVRAGVTSGVLAGVTVLAVSVATGIAEMNRLLPSVTHDAEYLRSGHADPAAYLIGACICGGAELLLACVAAGALLGLAASAGTAMAAHVSRRYRPGGSEQQG
jgi:hypothetical protein